MSARKYYILYQEVNALLHNAGIDDTIEILRSANRNQLDDTNLDNEYTRWDEDVIRKLINLVCKAYDIERRQEIINGTSRTDTKARKICFALMKWELEMQYNDIAQFFFKDESTVCRAIKGFQKDLSKNKEFEDAYNSIKDDFRVYLNKQTSLSDIK